MSSLPVFVGIVAWYVDSRNSKLSLWLTVHLFLKLKPQSLVYVKLFQAILRLSWWSSLFLEVVVVLSGWLVGRSKVFSNHPPPISVDVDVLDGGCCSRWLVVVAVSVDDV